jgi:hypothetical protein
MPTYSKGLTFVGKILPDVTTKVMFTKYKRSLESSGCQRFFVWWVNFVGLSVKIFEIGC